MLDESAAHAMGDGHVDGEVWRRKVFSAGLGRGVDAGGVCRSFAEAVPHLLSTASWLPDTLTVAHPSMLGPR